MTAVLCIYFSISFSDIVALVGHEWAPLIVSRWCEAWTVPGWFVLITDEHELGEEINGDQSTEGGYSSVGALLENVLQFWQENQNQTAATHKEWENVTFTSPLSSLALHEILWNENASVLVTFHLEPGYVMNDGVNYATSADEVGHHGDEEPDCGLQHHHSQVLHHC